MRRQCSRRPGRRCSSKEFNDERNDPVVASRAAAGGTLREDVVSRSESRLKSLKVEKRATRQKAKKLRNLLLTAQQADVRGQESAARNALTKFIGVAETVSQAAARAALVDAGKELRADL